MSAPKPAKIPTQVLAQSAKGTSNPGLRAATSSPIAAGNNCLSLENVKNDQARIALLAYSYWEERGCLGGSPEEDWHRAERFLATSRRN